MLYKWIFKIGVFFRNPSVPTIINFLQKSSEWDLQTLETYQLKKIKELIRYANKNCPYYQQQFKNLKVEEINTFEDFKQIPILTKENLLNFNKAIHSVEVFKNSKIASTSGSSGTTLQFVRDEWADSFNRATIFFHYQKYGVQPWDKNGYFWGFNFEWKQKQLTRFLDFIQNRFRNFSYEKKSFQQFVKKIQKATFIQGYSSMIYQTAKLINQHQLPKPQNLKMVKGTSEKIYESYQSEVKKAFGLKMISEYGATESGILAFECVKGNMHLNMEGVYVEEINSEIVVTNLQMKSFPIIRYKLGDYIELQDEKITCSCGSKHRILKEVTGRIGDNVYGKQQVYPSLYFYYIFKNIAKQHQLNLNYQVIQPKKGQLLFKIEQSLNETQLTIIRLEIEKYFLDDVFYEIESNAIILSENSKIKSFISKVSNSSNE